MEYQSAKDCSPLQIKITITDARERYQIKTRSANRDEYSFYAFESRFSLK